MNNPSLGEYLDYGLDLEKVQMAAGDKLEFTMESMMSFGEFISVLKGAVVSAAKAIYNYHETADMDHPVSASNLHDMLEEAGFSKVRSVTVYRVPLQEAPMEELVGVIQGQMEAMGDVEERLYRPLYKWLGKVINDTDLVEKAWIDRKLSFQNLPKLGKELKDQYGSRRMRTNDSETTEFINMYPSIKAFRETERKVYDMYERLKTINLNKLTELEREINRRLTTILDMSDDPEEDFVLSRSNKVQLAKVFRGIAEETEYLVAVLFQANQIVGAWNNTVDSVKTELTK